MTTPTESERIARVYRDYSESAAVQTRWDIRNPGNQAILRERHNALAALLRQSGLLPLAGRKVLEIGCGSGSVLASLGELGARQVDLYGGDLLPDRVVEAANQHPSINFLASNGEALPCADRQFDLVLVYTVFSSILDERMRGNVAAEAWRVLRAGGAVVWYDFRYNNPRNPHVRGQTRQDIQRLFPDAELRLQTLTLLPPLARRLGWATRLFYSLLVLVPILRTHYLGLLVKR